MKKTIKDKNIIFACLNYLIDNRREFTLNNLANYLSEHVEAMEYISEGDLPVDDDVIKAIKDIILATEVPNEDNFKGIVSIRTTFGFHDNRIYQVTFRRIEYYAEGVFYGSTIQNDTFKIPRETTAILNLTPSELNLQPKYI